MLSKRKKILTITILLILSLIVGAVTLASSNIYPPDEEKVITTCCFDNNCEPEIFERVITESIFYLDEIDLPYLGLAERIDGDNFDTIIFYGSHINPAIVQPSRPCCQGFPMSHQGTNNNVVNYNATHHERITTSYWLCLRSGCGRVTRVQVRDLLAHNFTFTSDAGHVTGTRTHRWNQRCQPCGRTRVVTFTCPGPPCISPQAISEEFD